MTTSKDVALELGMPEQSPMYKSPPPASKLPLVVGMPLVVVGLACLASFAVGAASLSYAVALEARLNDLEAKSQVIVSKSATPPDGFAMISSLLTGSGEWAVGQPMPAARSDLQAIYCNGTVTLLGGSDDDKVVQGTVYSFDPVQEVYSGAKTPMPTPRFRFGAACVADLIYVAGGYSDAATGDTGASLASVDIYDVAGDTWASGPALQVARGDLALVSVDGRLHAIGGYDQSWVATTTNEMLDPNAASSAWSYAAPMRMGKGDIQAVAAGGKLYVPGGWNDGFLDELAVYDAATDAWSEGANLAAPRGDKAVVALNGRVLVIGGEVGAIPMHGVEMYTPEQDTWTSLSPLPEARFRFAAAAVAGRAPTEGSVFAFGGHAHREVALASQWVFHDSLQPDLYFHQKE